MSLSKVEIRKGLSSFYENFARGVLFEHQSEIRDMNAYQFIRFIQDIIDKGNEIMHLMGSYSKRRTGITICNSAFELKLSTEIRHGITWCTISSVSGLNSSLLKIPIRIDISNADKFTLSQNICTFVEIQIGDYFNNLCEVIDESL